MSLIETAREDLVEILSNTNDFGEVVILDNPDNTVNLEIVGFPTKHRNTYSGEGNDVNVRQISVAIPERVLIQNSYPYKVNDKINFDKHKATITEASGNQVKYIVEQWYPDKQLGCIILFLGNYTETP